MKPLVVYDWILLVYRFVTWGQLPYKSRLSRPDAEDDQRAALCG